MCERKGIGDEYHYIMNVLSSQMREQFCYLVDFINTITRLNSIK